MSAVENGSAKAGQPLATPASHAPALPARLVDATASACTVEASPFPAMTVIVLFPSPPPPFSSLLAQARAAQAELIVQPLPIANRDMLLIQKLFGG